MTKIISEILVTINKMQKICWFLRKEKLIIQCYVEVTKRSRNMVKGCAHALQGISEIL